MRIYSTPIKDLRFLGTYENQEKRPCKKEHQCGDEKAENSCGSDRAFNPRANAIFFFGAVILSDEGGECVAEILHGHIGEGVDFYRGGKCGHDGRPEAVHQALYHQNTEIHDRLLHAGQQRKMRDLRHESPIKTHVAAGNTQARHTQSVELLLTSE